MVHHIVTNFNYTSTIMRTTKISINRERGGVVTWAESDNGQDEDGGGGGGRR